MTLKTLSAVAVVLLLGFFPNSAAAQNIFYVFGGVGNTDSDISFGGLNRVDDDDNSYVLGAGYAFSGSFSIEGAYHDLGAHNGETDCPPDITCLIVPLSAQADLTGISLSLVGNLPLVDRFGVYGKLGIFSWETEFKGISSAFDDSGEDLLLGVGLRWSIADNWKFSAEYTRLELDLDTAGIALSYHF